MSAQGELTSIHPEHTLVHGAAWWLLWQPPARAGNEEDEGVILQPANTLTKLLSCSHNQPRRAFLVGLVVVMLLAPLPAHAQPLEGWVYVGFQLHSITFTACSAWGCHGYGGPFQDLDTGVTWTIIVGFHVYYHNVTYESQFIPVVYQYMSCCYYI